MTRDDPDGFVSETEASAALEAIAVEGERTALRVSDAFEAAGDTIADALGVAARSGALDFADMAEAILQDLARIALEAAVIDPLNAYVAQLGGQVAGGFADVIGQRAEGGPVMAGNAYLVGERGPEVFVPSSAGAVAPTTSAPVINITIHSQGDALSTVQRSERQIAAAIARAAAAGGQMI